MDFGDILTLLIYIAIPVLISNKRKAQKASQQKRQPVQRQQVQDRTQGGGLIGRLESMMKEIERSIETGEPIGGKKPADTGKPVGGPRTTDRSAGMYTGSGPASDVSDASGQIGEPKPGQIPVWRVASAVVGKESAERLQKTRPQARKAVPAAAGKGSILFGKDDLIKGIILSEILQPPVVLRQNNKRRPF